MSEFWDLLDENARPTGEIHRRGIPLPAGRYHTIIGVWTVHRRLRRVLLTLRAPEKEVCPNTWENTGGSVLAGETSVDGAAREVREETGLPCTAADLTFITRLRTCAQTFVDCYYHLTDAPAASITLQPGETADYAWLTLEAIEARISDGSFTPPEVEQYDACKKTLSQVLKNL